MFQVIRHPLRHGSIESLIDILGQQVLDFATSQVRRAHRARPLHNRDTQQGQYHQQCRAAAPHTPAGPLPSLQREAGQFAVPAWSPE
jgi:hypothetical protein